MRGMYRKNIIGFSSKFRDKKLTCKPIQATSSNPRALLINQLTSNRLALSVYSNTNFSLLRDFFHIYIISSSSKDQSDNPFFSSFFCDYLEVRFSKTILINYIIIKSNNLCTSILSSYMSIGSCNKH